MCMRTFTERNKEVKTEWRMTGFLNQGLANYSLQAKQLRMDFTFFNVEKTTKNL